MADSGLDRPNSQETLMKACVLNLNGFVNDPECPARTMRRELKPSGAFAWPAKLAQLVGVGELANMLLLLRQSKLPKKEYRTLRQRISDYVADNSQLFPGRWEIWWGLIARYELAEITLWETGSLSLPSSRRHSSRIPITWHLSRDLIPRQCATPSSTGERSSTSGKLVNVCAKPRLDN